MRKFADRLRNEQGLTLVELLASLTLLTIIAGIIYLAITFGLESYHRVRIENALRDDGDLIMTTVMAEMYRFGPDIVTDLKDDSGHLIGIQMERTRDGLVQTIQIKDYTLYISHEDGTPDTKVDIGSRLLPGSSIKLNCGQLAQCSSGLIEVKLVLAQSYKNQEQRLELESNYGF